MSTATLLQPVTLKFLESTIPSQEMPVPFPNFDPQWNLKPNDFKFYEDNFPENCAHFQKNIDAFFKLLKFTNTPVTLHFMKRSQIFRDIKKNPELKSELEKVLTSFELMARQGFTPAFAAYMTAAFFVYKDVREPFYDFLKSVVHEGFDDNVRPLLKNMFIHTLHNTQAPDSELAVALLGFETNEPFTILAFESLVFPQIAIMSPHKKAYSGPYLSSPISNATYILLTAGSFAYEQTAMRLVDPLNEWPDEAPHWNLVKEISCDPRHIQDFKTTIGKSRFDFLTHMFAMEDMTGFSNFESRLLFLREIADVEELMKEAQSFEDSRELYSKEEQRTFDGTLIDKLTGLDALTSLFADTYHFFATYKTHKEVEKTDAPHQLVASIKSKQNAGEIARQIIFSARHQIISYKPETYAQGYRSQINWVQSSIRKRYMHAIGKTVNTDTKEKIDCMIDYLTLNFMYDQDIPLNNRVQIAHLAAKRFGKIPYRMVADYEGRGSGFYYRGKRCLHEYFKSRARALAAKDQQKEHNSEEAHRQLQEAVTYLELGKEQSKGCALNLSRIFAGNMHDSTMLRNALKLAQDLDKDGFIPGSYQLAKTMARSNGISLPPTELDTKEKNKIMDLLLKASDNKYPEAQFYIGYDMVRRHSQSEEGWKLLFDAFWGGSDKAKLLLQCDDPFTPSQNFLSQITPLIVDETFSELLLEDTIKDLANE